MDLIHNVNLIPSNNSAAQAVHPDLLPESPEQKPPLVLQQSTVQPQQFDAPMQQPNFDFDTQQQQPIIAPPIIPQLPVQQEVQLPQQQQMQPIPTQVITPQSQNSTPPNTSRPMNLFVAGLLPTTTEEDIRSLFAPYGEIESTKLMLDTRTGASRGFGFVLFVDAESGNKALNALNGQRFGSARLHISVSQHDGRIGESTQLYIRNIPLGIPESDIRQYFLAFGEATLFVLRTGNGSFGADGSRQTQHLTIQYATIEDAKKALAACHGSTPFPGSKSPILAKFSESTHTRINRRAQRDRNKASSGVPVHGGMIQQQGGMVQQPMFGGVPQQQMIYAQQPQQGGFAQQGGQAPVFVIQQQPQQQQMYAQATPPPPPPLGGGPQKFHQQHQFMQQPQQQQQEIVYIVPPGHQMIQPQQQQQPFVVNQQQPQQQQQFLQPQQAPGY